jgi:hypothetical protein
VGKPSKRFKTAIDIISNYCKYDSNRCQHRYIDSGFKHQKAVLRVLRGV